MLNFALFSILLPPEVEIGRNLQLVHRGFGVVIHPNTVIGNDVTILHHVTLGTDTPQADPRRCIVEDGAMIGAGAIVLGPVVIGSNARIGAGAVVTHDVPAGAVMVGNPARILVSKTSRKGGGGKSGVRPRGQGNTE